jgi:hypothetical protein
MSNGVKLTQNKHDIDTFSKTELVRWKLKNQIYPWTTGFLDPLFQVRAYS